MAFKLTGTTLRPTTPRSVGTMKASRSRMAATKASSATTSGGVATTTSTGSSSSAAGRPAP